MFKDWMKSIVYDVADSGGGTVTVATSSTPESSGSAAPATSSGLTQADVDKAAAAARKQAEKEAVKIVATQFGFDSAEAMKTFFEEVKAKAEAEKSEHQKALDRVAALEKERDTAKQEAETLKAQAREKTRDDKILDALRAANARIPADALVLMKSLGKIDSILKEDGTMDEKAVEKAVTDFKASRADHFGTGNPGSLSNTKGKPPTSEVKIPFKKIGR